jgi:hypothetical protein
LRDHPTCTSYGATQSPATRGRKVAKRDKRIVKKQMTPAQIAEAQKLSSELWEKYVVPFQKD